MKIKLMVSEARHAAIAQELLSCGIELDDDAELVLSEAHSFADCFVGKRDGEHCRVFVEDIVYIESLAHEILAHTCNGEYRMKERLWQWEKLLNPQEFLRISNSVIIAKKKVVRIKPALSQKFTLTLINGSQVDVTRSYYYMFKDQFGI